MPVAPDLMDEAVVSVGADGNARLWKDGRNLAVYRWGGAAREGLKGGGG